ncbi:MAG TPA: thioredoxin family protein [Verrucomicrobiae bacterium]|nr:thioredoxin family protein [Verrucomicrobiae bacterium]
MTFRSRTLSRLGLVTLSLACTALAQPGPYRPDADARKDVAAAQARARASHKVVMVIFGANWCEDCRVLHNNLDSAALHDYVQSHFEVVSVDVGQFDKNLDVVKSAGADLKKGIPVAAFLSSDGALIGTTNNGELEPSRKYGAQQVLRFLREVVDNHKITTPQ